MLKLLVFKIDLSGFFSLKFTRITIDDLHNVQCKLNPYMEELDKRVNMPFLIKHTCWFIYCIIALIVVFILLYIPYKFKVKVEKLVETAVTADSPVIAKAKFTKPSQTR